ncbi:MAG: cation-translocating P-type ATPase [Nitrospinae bacterium]|nr:cation-translocating P-type ATPase [Nitrospinota bacterium]
METGFDLENLQGLSTAEAIRRLSGEGYNDLPASKPKSSAAIAREVVGEPMFLLLTACGALYLVLGDVQEALILLSFVFVIMGITFYQERKTERSLEALRDLSSPRALVVRDGLQQRIPGREVVRDDLVILMEGDRVPADSFLLSSINLVVDESALTGESAPVRKAPGGSEKREMGKPGGEDLPYLFSGTLVVRGQGVAKVLRIGLHTEIGKIGSSLRNIETEQTLLWKETRRVVRLLAATGLGLCALVSLLYVLNTGKWVDSLLAGLTLAMSILPEEMPVILTIFLALGAWRISQKNVLTRHVPVVETLGAATVLCVDKTGTLTQNSMTVSRLYAGDAFFTVMEGARGLPEAFHDLVEHCILAGKKDPFDPMEKAITDMGRMCLAGSEHLHSYERELLREYPLSKQFPALTHVWRSPGREGLVIASKGAPETIANLCHLDERRAGALTAAANAMARDGLRVLGVAKGVLAEAALPDDQHDFELEFVGLAGFTDPVRPAVPSAVAECRQAGIRIVMITGDYPETAKSVARAIGFSESGQCVTGAQVEAMDDETLAERIKRVTIFARVVPEQKLRIVDALKKNGEIVAMTGDGVNDAPALKSAHIGIAMGARGTDVAREAAALVLTDDDFSSIVAAVRSGRRIYDNIKKAMAFTVAVHVPIAGMAMIPAFFGLPLIFMPVHIVFLEMVIDPACSIVFEREPEETGIMERPPRRTSDPLFSGRMVLASTLLGGAVFAVVLAVFGLALWRGAGMEEARTLSFVTLLIATVGLIFANRSLEQHIVQAVKNPNQSLWWLCGGAAAFLGLVIYVPWLRQLFGFRPPDTIDWLICIVAGAATIGCLELIRMAARRRKFSAA